MTVAHIIEDHESRTLCRTFSSHELVFCNCYYKFVYEKFFLFFFGASAMEYFLCTTVLLGVSVRLINAYTTKAGGEGQTGIIIAR